MGFLAWPDAFVLGVVIYCAAQIYQQRREQAWSTEHPSHIETVYLQNDDDKY